MEVITTNRKTTARIYQGDCLDVLQGIEPVDCVVTDPPYGLSFMGKGWDHKVPGVEIWKSVFDALKPGGYLLAFAGTRTQHRMACAIEDAGFEIRDMIAWVYGSGFPKSMDVGKAIDKAAGAEREVVGTRVTNVGMQGNNYASAAKSGEVKITAPATEDAKKWDGWGTALKPALEPITVARKPIDGTVANNVLKHGVGAINIDTCRIDIGDEDDIHEKNPGTFGGFGHAGARKGDGVPNASVYADAGSAARFFYVPKADRKERGKGNNHPTVKPLDLMKYLCRMVAPEGAVVLDPFMGSGSTGIAALQEGCSFIGIELNEGYYQIAKARIQGEAEIGRLF